MVVYLVTTGAYDSYRIDEAFSSRYLANKYKKWLEENYPHFMYGPRVETVWVYQGRDDMPDCYLGKGKYEY